MKIVLALWIALAIAATLAEYNERSVLDRWGDRVFTTSPTNETLEGLLAFSLANGVPCDTPEGIINITPECKQVMDFAGEFKSAQDLALMFFSGFLFLFVVISVIVASFAYQANRNLLTLKTEGQKFSSTGALLWLFAPMINFFKGPQIFGEIWRGSHPEGVTSGGEEWKSRSSKWWIDAWWLTVAVVAIMFANNILRGSPFATNIIDDRLGLAWWAMLWDLFLIIPAVLALKAMTGIHDMQEKRHEIVGPHLAVPPPGGTKL